MKKFTFDKLPESATKAMYTSQKNWSAKNLKDTIEKHYKEIEVLLQKTDAFGSWRNILESKYGQVAKMLIPEIYMDAYISILFACQGLYKQANVCIRAELETALRLIYFSKHTVEFNWWNQGEDYFKKNSALWGEGYLYFTRLEEIKNFQKKCKENKYEIDLFSRISNLYRKLSQYVHSGISSFQTTPYRISPKYGNKEFGKWMNTFNEIQTYINTLLILGFAEEFRNAQSNIQRSIIKVIKNPGFKKGLRKSLPLKLKGRI